MLRSKDKKLNLGKAISAEVFNPEWPDHIGSSRERIIHLGSPEFGCADLMILGANLGVTTYAASQKPLAIPFRVFKPMIVHQLGWRNGSSVVDSIDIGIYDTSWNRKISTGAVVRSGAQALQWSDITDTLLPVGKYYIVQCPSAVTASNFIQVGSVSIQALATIGCMDSATSAYPLPNPLTNMVACATITFIAPVVMAARELF